MYHLLIGGIFSTKCIFALLVGVLVGALVGCGGGSDDSATKTASSSEPSVTIPWGPKSFGRAEYIKRAEQVCKEGRTSMPTSFRGRYRNVNSGKLYTEATSNIFLPGIQLWFDDVAYLGAPPGEKPQVAELLTAMQRAVYASEAQHIVSSGQLIAQFAHYNQLAREYGLNRCLVEGVPFAAT